MKYALRTAIAALLLVTGAALLPVSAAESADDLPGGAEADVVAGNIREKAEALITRPVPDLPEPPMPEASVRTKDETVIPAGLIRLKPFGALTIDELEALVPSQEVAVWTAPYENRDVTFSELNALSADLEKRLRGRGLFAVTRIPPQDVSPGGEVVIEVLLARMGELSVEGNRYSRTALVKSYWQIEPGDILRVDPLRNSLAAMNMNPDRTVRQILKAGAVPGTSDVVLKVEEKLPVHAGYSLDNQGIALTGKRRHTFTARHNNMLSLDDTFLIGTAFGEDFGALFMQHLIPVNRRGTELMWGISHAQVTPQKEFEALGINGISQIYSLKLQQRLANDPAFSANGYLGIDFKEKRTRQRNVTVAWDRLRVLKGGGNLRKQHHAGVTDLSQEFSFGLSPHGDGFALNSRQGEPHFFKYGFTLSRRQSLPFDVTAVLRMRGQLSPNKLLPQEQIFLGGMTSVRGYPETDFGADQAIVTNLECFVPLPLPPGWKLPGSDKPFREQIQLVTFLDHAYGRVHGPSAGKKRSYQPVGIGGGINFVFRKNLSARLEWGVPVGETPVTEAADSQFHFRLTTGF